MSTISTLIANPTLQTEALEAALQNKIDEGEMAALTIGDHTITAAKLAQGVIDNTLATSGAAADAKKTGDEISAIKADLGAVEGLNEDIKQALLDCFSHVAFWTEGSGDSYIAALRDALYKDTPGVWDYEWDYTDGLPNDNGMTLTNNGGTISLTNSGLSVSTQNSSSSNVIYKYESVSTTPLAKTITELVFVINAFTSQAGGGVRYYAGLGGVPGTAKKVGQFLIAQDGIKYLSGSSWVMLYSGTFTTGTEYTLKVVQTEDNADVYINGSKVGSLTEFSEGVANPQFTVHRGASAIFKSFKLRFFEQEATA